MHLNVNKYVLPRNTRTEMHAGHVARRPLLNYNAPRAVLRLEKKIGQTEGQTDGCQTVTLRFSVDVIIML